jgi:ABC-type amino acid transport substrate-binding protein
MTKTHSKFRTLPVLCLTWLLAGAAGAGDLADVKARGKLVMLTFPAVDDPFVAVDVEAMRAAGLKLVDMRDPAAFRGVDVDLVRGFALSLGVKLEMRPLTGGYGELLPALVAAQGDLAASRLTITPKRKEAADFSAPYYIQWAVAAVPKNSRLSTLADLKGKRVAVMKGSSQFEFLALLNLSPEIRVTSYNLESYTAALEGQADYALMDSRAAVGEPVSAQFSELKVGVRVHPVEQAVMLRKGSDLKAPLDAYIDGLRKSGELEKILAKYGQGTAGKPAAPKP